jgi:hypothetical protein
VLSENSFMAYIFIAIHDVTGTVNVQQELMEMKKKDALTGVRNGLNLDIRLKRIN